MIDFPTKPTGDPGAIRAAARQVTVQAQKLGTLGSTVSRGVDDMTFQGPAAGRIRGDVRAWRGQTNTSVQELEAIAESLNHAADRLQADLERYKRDFARAERAEDERRREAQRRHL